MILKRLKERRINKVLDDIDKKDLFQRYLLLIVGCFIVAFSFNVFFEQYGIVCFGVSGLSLVFKNFGIPTYVFILIANIILLIISYFVLGKKKTKNAVVGSLLLPILVWLSKPLVQYINLDDVERLVIAMSGGVLSGLGYGLIFKTNFNTGGTDVITEIVAKYTKVSLGKATWVSDGLVVLSGKLVYSWETVLYGFMVLYIISFMTDKVVLGISESKAFYIVTEKEDEVKDFLLSITNGGVTIMNAKGGFSNAKETLMLGVVPTRQYFTVKEGLKDIDPKIFFLVCDSYEVSNKRKKH